MPRGRRSRRAISYTRIEKPPFQAAVDAARATVDQMKAQHRNAQVTLQRAQTLLNTPAGQQSNVDAALASERALAAQIAGAQAQLETALINLGYTEIRALIDGKISETALTEGNVVSPTSGTLATIVSQDPMSVRFSISLREGLDLRARYANKGGYNAAVIKLRLPDGRISSNMESSTIPRPASRRIPIPLSCAEKFPTRCFRA